MYANMTSTIHLRRKYLLIVVSLTTMFAYVTYFPRMPNFVTSLHYNAKREPVSPSGIATITQSDAPSPTQQSQSHASDADTTPRNPEWEQLNKYDFFRRTAAFYSIHKNESQQPLFRILFQTKRDAHLPKNMSYALHFVINYANKTYELQIPADKVFIVRHNVLLDANDQETLDSTFYRICSLNYNATSLVDELNTKYNLNLSAIAALERRDTFDMKVFITDFVHKLTTKSAIDVEVHVEGDRKQGSMVCSFCYFYDNREEEKRHLPIVWWIETNKLIGYKLLGVCNNSLSNTPRYRDLFAKHVDYLQITQANYVPNFLSNQDNLSDDRHDYLTNFDRMHESYAKVVKPFKWSMQVMIYNECFMRNRLKYKYIAVQDSDEIVVPRFDERLKQNNGYYNYFSSLDMSTVNDQKSLRRLLNIESTCKVATNSQQNKDTSEEAPIDAYLKYLTIRANRTRPFHFEMADYLSEETVVLIIEHFEKFLASTRSIELKYPQFLSFIDPSYNNFIYHIVLNSTSDMQYLRNMAKIYRLLVIDFKKQHGNYDFGAFNQYDRFMYRTPREMVKSGKSIHNTDLVLSTRIHIPDESSERLEWVKAYDNALNSHFRSKYNFDYSNGLNMSVDQLRVDLEYFFCYFRPAFKLLYSIDPIVD